MPKLAFWGVFTWAVDRKGSQVGMCVNRSNTSSTHLSLLCIFCMWERASGKSPLFFIAASHTILFPSALEQDWGKPFVCVCVCIYALAPRHLRSHNENPSLPGEPQTGRHTERLRSDTRLTWLCTLAHVFRHTWVAHLWARKYTIVGILKCHAALQP